MYALASLMALIGQVAGTPYISGGDTPAGTDCSGLASWVANVASGRPAFGSRFNTGNIEGALLSRGFHYGSAPNSVVIGWNSGHTAVTLPDGTPVSSGEGGAGVRVGGGGAFQPQFSHHMYLPVEAQPMAPEGAPPPPEGVTPAGPEPAPAVPDPAAPQDGPVPGPEPAAAELPADAPVGAPAQSPPEAAVPAPDQAPEPLPVEVAHAGAGAAPGTEAPAAAI